MRSPWNDGTMSRRSDEGRGARGGGGQAPAGRPTLGAGSPTIKLVRGTLFYLLWAEKTACKAGKPSSA